MPRHLRNALGWVAATAAAVAIAHAGVSAVAGRVVDPLPPAVGLADAATGEGPSSGPSSRPTATGTSEPRTEATTASSTPTSAPTASPPTSVAPPPTSAPTTAASAQATPSASPSSAPDEVRSYALVGGSATLRYEAGRVTVVSAEPAQGFTLDVEGDGTDEVTVEFENDDHRSRLRGAWEDGVPRDRIDEDGRSDDDEVDDEVDDD